MNRIEKIDLINRIVARASKMKLLKFDKLSLMMDLDCVDNEVGLRLEDLLNADDFNFIHDICGIQANLDREQERLVNFFLPRFSGK